MLMKSILLIGLGRFGTRMAQKLHELDQQVLAIDRSEENVDAVLPYVTNAQIGDSTNPKLIASLGPSNFDLCVVAIGEDFKSSLETTALLKEFGAPFVLSRATNDFHAKFLLRNGADEIVYPEQQMADWTAVRYSNDHIFDYVELTKDYAVYETDIPKDWVGKTVVDLSVRRKYGINVLAVRQNDTLNPMPGLDYHFCEGDRIFILASREAAAKFVPN